MSTAGRCRWTLLCGRIGDRLVASTPPGARDRRAGATPAPVAREPAPPPPRRFLWSLDRAERFGAIDPGLAAAFGPLAPQPGEPLATFRARVGFDRDGQFAQILAARRTFAVLPLAWPEIAGADPRMALLSGSPTFDRDRNFAGWRGFGLFGDEAATGAGRSARAAPPAPLEAPPATVAAPSASARPTAEPPAPDAPTERSADMCRLARAAARGQCRADPPRRDVAARRYARAAAAPPRGANPSNSPATSATRSARSPARSARGCRGGRDQDGGEAPRDLIDLAPAPEAATPERNAATLIDRLPIGAMVLRGGEPLYLNRTLLDLAGYRDLAEFRAADGLTPLFRGRDAQTLAEDRTRAARCRWSPRGAN